MSASQQVEVRPAEWPRDVAPATDLLTAYFQWLAENPAIPAAIRLIDRAPELQTLPARYGRGSATLLLAWLGDWAVGCAAVYRLADPPTAAEMKRLYVAPQARGCGAGRALIHAAVGLARHSGAAHLLLDTLPAAMPGAVSLYRSAGFQPTARYNGNDGAGFAFFRLPLG